MNVAMASKVESGIVMQHRTALLGAEETQGDHQLWEIKLCLALPTVHLDLFSGNKHERP